MCTVYNYHWLLTETIESYLIATACITQIVLSLALQRKCHEMTEWEYYVWSATMLLLYFHFKQALQIMPYLYTLVNGKNKDKLKIKFTNWITRPTYLSNIVRLNLTIIIVFLQCNFGFIIQVKAWINFKEI